LLLWILIALLTAAAILAVLVPLARRPAGGDAAEHAAQVYRDQLAELERDKAEGRISAGEAEAARAEIARRLIAADEETKAWTIVPDAGNVGMRRATAVVALIGIPLLSLTLYLGLGAPALPGAPLAARLSEPLQSDDFEMMIRKVEEHLALKPEDGRGWEVIAPVYLRLGRLENAEEAYRNAIRLLGATAPRQIGLGEAIFASEGGIVTAEARAAFEAANGLDPAAPIPRFFLGLAAEQEGKKQEAADAWRALLADTPAGAAWRPAVEKAFSRVAPDETPPVPAGPSQPGPSEEQVAAAQDMPEGDRAAMIESMVSGLAARLKDEPGDVEGWLKLIRSYVVLGRADAAADAARSALDGVNAADRGKVEALIADLGVTPAGAATP
jgi:cytochrome c-type biogenesis protein CcmH